MKYSFVINQFNRTKYVHRAIQSCQRLTKNKDDTIEVIVVSDFEIRSEKNRIKNIVTPESAIGYRYAQGLKQATGDWIFLLDDDDYFLIDKLQRYKSIPNNIQVIKEYTGPRMHTDIADNKHTWKTWLKQVIDHHIDWHGSQYCFNQQFKEKLFANDIQSVNTSFDKYLFAIAMDDIQSLWLLNLTRTVKVNHPDSKMHSMTSKDKRDFYLRTINMISHVQIPSLYKDYTYDLNAFLATGHAGYYEKIKEYLPLLHRIYYQHIWKPYADIEDFRPCCE